jgi:hypothetical protein
LAGIVSGALTVSGSSAGGWETDCGYCDHQDYSPHSVYYARPTYSYAKPTVTFVPHYVVRPNYVVHRTYIIPRTYHLTAPPYARPSFCDDNPGDLVNQGQYRTRSALVPARLFCGVHPSYGMKKHWHRGAGYRWRHW